jgi:hypothetical protein
MNDVPLSHIWKKNMLGSDGWGWVCRFAAEIFNGLHDEVMSIMGCCHELRARVLKLETDLPNVEKSLQSEATLFRLIYSPGNMLNIITSLKVQKRIRD